MLKLSMAYSRDYFALQIEFAKKASELLNISLADTLIEYTGFYKTFRISGWKFDKDDLTWLKYLKEIQKSTNLVDTTYDFYLKRLEGREQQDVNISKQFGCFSYENSPEENCIYIHFRNLDGAEPGPLSLAKKDIRLKELTEMFSEIKHKNTTVKYVAGFSWLYNLEAYRRLFPQEYTQDMQVNSEWFRSSAIWGQFLDSAGEIKTDLTHKFLKDVHHAKTLVELKTSFPFKLLEPKTEINNFYKFYGLTP